MRLKVTVDSTTRSRLGRSTLAGIRSRLLAIDCQTCGRPFGGDTPSLVIECAGDLATATLHHHGCRAPGWSDVSRVGSPRLPTLTWRAVSLLWLPYGLPVFVVNPSCEEATLRWTGTEWRAADLDGFRAAGLAEDIGQATAHPVPGLVATVGQQRLTVELAAGATTFSWSSSGLGPSVAGAVDSLDTVLVAVTAQLDPASGITSSQLATLMFQRTVVFGRADVRFAPEAQALRSTDLEPNARNEMIAIGAEMVRRALGIEVGERVLSAVLAVCHGDGQPVGSLSGNDRILALLLVAGLYAGRSTGGTPQGTHVLVPDEDTADRFRALYQPVCQQLGLRADLVPGRGHEADIVIGTPEQFAAARSRSAIRRGRLAITVDVDAGPLDQYPRVLTVGDSPQDEVEQRLLGERVLVLNADIDDDIANRLTAQLLILAAEDQTADITLYINSPGGSLTAAMAILDTMSLVEPDVATCAMGLAAGTAQLLLSAGAPGKRSAVPTARVMLLLPKAAPDQDGPDLVDRWTREVVALTARATGQPEEQIHADAQRQRAFSAVEAVEYGLVDRVLERPADRQR